MNELLSIALSGTIPLNIMTMKGKGGPTNDDFNRCTVTGQLLAEHGDILLYKGKNEKTSTADLFNRVAEAIAVMSFLPGGITMFNQHYETLVDKSFIDQAVKMVRTKSKLKKAIIEPVKKMIRTKKKAKKKLKRRKKS